MQAPIASKRQVGMVSNCAGSFTLSIKIFPNMIGRGITTAANPVRKYFYTYIKKSSQFQPIPTLRLEALRGLSPETSNFATKLFIE